MLEAIFLLNVLFQTLISKTVPEDGQPSLLIDAVEYATDEKSRIECLLVHVAESTSEQKDKYRTQFLTMLEWATFVSGRTSV